MSRCFAVLLVLLAWLPCAAVETTPGIARLEPIVVSGAQPGPGLWKVSRDGHVLWVLGVLSPLPKGMQWQTAEVAGRVGESQQVLDMPELGLDANLGFFGRLSLLPSLVGARNNPDHARLVDVVPAAQYARWSVLKEKYIGRSRKVEKWRPLFAAMELYTEAIDKAGLRSSREVVRAVRAIAEAAGVERVPVKLELQISDPRAAVKAFKRSAMDDLACFDATLDRIENDLGTMARRANAWATGDLAALRALPYTDSLRECMDAALNAGALRERGLSDAEARMQRTWLDAAKAALARNRSTFALLPMDRVIAGDGFLAALAEAGYAVEAPDEAIEDESLDEAGSADADRPGADSGS